MIHVYDRELLLEVLQFCGGRPRHLYVVATNSRRVKLLLTHLHDLALSFGHQVKEPRCALSLTIDGTVVIGVPRSVADVLSEESLQFWCSFAAPKA